MTKLKDDKAVVYGKSPFTAHRDSWRGNTEHGERNGALRAFADAMAAAAHGDFSVRLPQWDGLLGECARSFNLLVSMNEKTSNEIMRIAKAIGEEGLLDDRMSVPGDGPWKRSEEIAML